MNAHRDISEIVKGLLPVPLIEKVRESENALGKNIVFVEDASLPGRAKGSANPEGIIRLSSALNTTKHRVGLPVVYVQAALLAAPSAEQVALLRMFDEPAFTDPRNVGQALCAEIDAVQNASPAEVERSMKRCLENYLGINSKGATIRTFTYPTQKSQLKGRGLDDRNLSLE